MEQIIPTQPESEPAQAPGHDFAISGKIACKANIMVHVKRLIKAALIIPPIG
ncbi:hypothetical protein [Synechococcus sp. CBW1107]|uniref:hypothetical protein n=1 Tax=Synechococcus sp. CBW1107 TaxID=2789857 RepID=UPI002AD2CAE9|nr:hypothetical protein [Synechococcus sp. CBW1107]